MITVEHLTKRYGSVTAVDDISFTIEDGHIYGFLGPNGAGKSTTMNIMTGCLAATSGEVKIDGFDIFEQARQAKQCIGYLPEIPPLYTDETPEEYLRFVAEAKGIAKRDIPAEITRVMRETRLTEMGGRLIRNLSKGYRQRVGIAQALLGNPRYIILDEPTVGLDPLQIIEIRDLIRELGEKHTVILSSHILSEVQAICESVLIIAHGKLVAFDTPQNLEMMLAANNRLTIVAETDEPGLRAILDRQKAVSDYTIETDDLPPVAAPAEKPAPQAEPAAPAETDAEPAAEEEQTLAAAPVDLTEAVLPTDPATAPKVCKATLTLAGDPAEACRTLFFAFARAGCALLQMTPVRADLENIFIELTEDEPSGKEEPTHESRI
ncbi:MAG: ABC transporter ATP-binding protein [Gemmiger sp.]|uniref:ABC transporter ATP-binding protein n=1 Tax=Gemmiger sp. TaxID=2049027 RepID=UPI002E7627CC|nr:ABC transporter ATP-binding protein [Gemmiger sp.]MEE0709375.1 ABC transporter ATP-binding protein [Gemmiger sp.]